MFIQSNEIDKFYDKTIPENIKMQRIREMGKASAQKKDIANGLANAHLENPNSTESMCKTFHAIHKLHLRWKMISNQK